jgi:hypothetical protein
VEAGVEMAMESPFRLVLYSPACTVTGTAASRTALAAVVEPDAGCAGKRLEKPGHRFVRYADDCNIYVRSQNVGERVPAGIELFLEKRLKLKINRPRPRLSNRAFASSWDSALLAGQRRGGALRRRHSPASRRKSGR